MMNLQVCELVRKTGQFTLKTNCLTITGSSDTQVCRDIGTAEFCASIKPACARLGYSQHTKARYALKYCRKTCGLCTTKEIKKPGEFI